VQVSSLGWQTDLMLRRLAGAQVEDCGAHLVVRTPANPNFYWGNFVLCPPPPDSGSAEQWLTTFAAAHPDARHVAVGVDGTAGGLGDDAGFRAAGLESSVDVVLTAETLSGGRALDPEATVRLLDSADDWVQSAQLRQEMDDDAGDNPEMVEFGRVFAERRQREFRDLAAAGHGVHVGAFVDGRLRASLGLYGAEGLARFQSVETHPDFRRRGLATALLLLADRELRARMPVERLVIVADPSYVAIGIYRELGFRDAELKVQWERAPGKAVSLHV
jgi:ribosomal protein S18 acetylase RimI-like enzyme